MKSKNKKKTALIISEIPWHFPVQRHHHLAYYLVKNDYNVKFLIKSRSRIPKPVELFKKFFSFSSTVQSAKTVNVPLNGVELYYFPLLPPLNVVLRLINSILIRYLIKKFMSIDLVYNFGNNPSINQHFQRLDQCVFIQDIVHDWENYQWHQKTHRQLYMRMIETTDNIVTDSPVTQSKLTKKGKNPFLMLPGVDPIWFAQEKPVEDRRQHKQIKAIFFGNLRANSDIKLLQEINSIFDVDIFGRIDESVGNHTGFGTFKGFLSPEDLSVETQKYDLIILPYSNAKFNNSIVPAKFFEALATGKVVVTRFDVSHIPGNEFILRWPEIKTRKDREKIMSLISERQKQSLVQIDFCKTHMWSSRFDGLARRFDI